jgi:hypothetical protein
MREKATAFPSVRKENSGAFAEEFNPPKTPNDAKKCGFIFSAIWRFWRTKF